MQVEVGEVPLSNAGNGEIVAGSQRFRAKGIRMDERAVGRDQCTMKD